MLFGHLSHVQSHGHQTTSAPAPTASTTTPGPITAASSRRRSPCAESATRALFAWPNNGESRQPESIVTNKSAADRLPGVLLYVLLLHCCTAVLGRFVGAWWVVGGCWVVGGWWTAARPLPEMAEYLQKRNPPPSVCCFIQLILLRPTCTAIPEQVAHPTCTRSYREFMWLYEKKVTASSSTPGNYMNNSLTPITGLLSRTTQVNFSFCLILNINLQCVQSSPL